MLLISMAFVFMPAGAQEQGFQVVSADTVEIDSIWLGHSPKKASLYSAVLPGMGQAYNRKYWKIPIVYAGLIGFGYSAYWNSQEYEYYFGLYKYMKESGEEEYEGRTLREVEWYKDAHLRYKNLFIIITVGFYALQIVDASVDAHLIDYDISDELSLRVDPVMIGPGRTGPEYAGSVLSSGARYPVPGMNSTSFGLRCSLNF